MKPYTTIELTEQDAVVTVHLHWPDAGQLSQALLSDLVQLMDDLEDESDCTLIVFQGLSTPQPSVGSAPPSLDQCSKWEKFLLRLERFAGASIACIDGFCTRFQFQLALTCDYRLATSRSVFQAPEVKEGYLPGMGVFRLAKYTGLGVARRFLFTSAQWSAAEATALGILDRQCEVTTLAKAIEEAQHALMPIHPEVLLNVRRLLNESFATSFEDAIGHFLAAQNLCLAKLSR